MPDVRQTRTLLLCALGGTISLDRDPCTGRNVAAYTAADLLARTAYADATHIRCVDAPDMLKTIQRPADLLALARFLNQEMQKGEDGVVITQGTDILEEVAYFLDEVFPPERPVVCTGAMRPAWAADYDGVRNLEQAVSLAQQVSLGYGVLVSLHEQVFEAWSVYKADTGALRGFAARCGAPWGGISGGQIDLPWRPSSRTRFGVLPTALPGSVPILAMGVGDDAVLLDQLGARSAQGVVIASMGAGSIPPLACEKIMRLAARGVPVVLCSSAVGGRTAEEEYYPGAYDELRAAGVVIEDHLNARKARIRLMLSVGLGRRYTPFGR